jgi:hypothetical protein
MVAYSMQCCPALCRRDGGAIPNEVLTIKKVAAVLQLSRRHWLAFAEAENRR